MSKPNDGGAAFPMPYSREYTGTSVWSHDGMSLRQYYAGQALAELLADPNGIEDLVGEYAYSAVNLADALIAELAKVLPG